jgi:hypothetical protein
VEDGRVADGGTIVVIVLLFPVPSIASAPDPKRDVNDAGSDRFEKGITFQNLTFA